MRLVSCHIVGFGKMINRDFNFNDGLNAWVEENGWGKTTLSVFIKSMFFGLEYSRKKEISERMRYRPWTGEDFGGSLIFQIEDKTYRIERSFGKKDKEDTFALFDEASGLPSTDYSDQIGEEIFLVDQDAFEKSVFIPQGKLETAKSESLNAKMGNLAAAKDDISNFDDAIKRLEEAKGSYSRRGTANPGKLQIVRKEIRACKEARERLPVLNDAIEKQRAMLEEKRIRLSIYENEKKHLANLITEQSRQEQELGVYREKKNVYEKLNEEYFNLATFFKDGIPNAKDVEIYDDMERRLEIDRSECLRLAEEMPEPADANRLRTLFDGHMLTTDELEEYGKSAERILNLRVETEHAKMAEEDKEHLSELKVVFAKHIPTEEELAEAQEDAALLTQLEGQTQTLEKYCDELVAKYEKEREAAVNGGPSAFLFALVAAVVMVIGGICLFIFTGSAGTVAAISCFIVAAVIVFISFFARSRRRKNEQKHEETRVEEIAQAKKELEEKRQEYSETQDWLHAFLSDYLFSPTNSYIQMVNEIQRKSDLYDRLCRQEEKFLAQSENSIEELSAMQMQLYTALGAYADVYDIDLYETHEESELIAKLKEDLSVWNTWTETKEKTEFLRKEEAELRSEINAYLCRFEAPEGDDLKDKLMNVRKKRDRLLIVTEELAGLKEEMDAFEASNKTVEDMVSVESLQKEQAVADEKISEYTNLIAKDKEILSDMTDEREAYEEKSEALPELLEKEARYTERMELFEHTISYLTEAKDRFMQRYMGPLQRGLRHYLGEVMGEDADDVGGFTLDMDLRVVYKHNGMISEREYLSFGYQDLTAVCARLALIDVLYTSQKPPVIMDDPFANLDEDKIRLALKLLEEISKDRQILYFCCHETRMPTLSNLS